MLVHDEHIGVGANFHLYRLPDSVERAVAQEAVSADSNKLLHTILGNRETALPRLNVLSLPGTNRAEGPVLVGSYSDIEVSGVLQESASHYLRAFNEGYKCFPYMWEAK